MKQKNPKKKPIYGTWHDRLLYFREDNYRGFLALIFVVINFLILFVAILAFGLLGDTTGLGYKDIIWKGISIMLDPGNLEPDPSLLITIILSLITIVAMICFSSGMVAFLSNILNDHLDDVREGDNEIHYDHFTLFLGWNDRGLELLKAFMLKDSQNSVTDFVVILSGYNGRDLREKIQKQLKEYMKYHEEAHELRILVRTGDPADYGSLLTVNCLNADEVFILRDDEDHVEPDYGVERTFFSLMHAYGMKGETSPKKVSSNTVDIVVEAITEETSDLVMRFQPREAGIRSFTTSAFSTARILGQKYAGLVPHQDRIVICNVNLTVPYMLEELKKQAEANAERTPKVLLIIEEDQEDAARELYEDSRFEELWEQAPVIFYKEMELYEKLRDRMKSGWRSLFILSDYYKSASVGDHHSFGLWASLADTIESDEALGKEAGNGVFFEIQDETDAQIMESFAFGQCIITEKLISDHMVGICRDNGLLPEESA